MNVTHSPKKKGNPLGPLVGFIVFLVGGVLSWFVAPPLTQWLQSASLEIPLIGAVLPIEIPADWPALVVRGGTALIVFIMIIILFMAVNFILMDTSPPEGDIRLAEIRAQKESKSGKKKKRRR